jgi:hypothetical protein
MPLDGVGVQRRKSVELPPPALVRDLRGIVDREKEVSVLLIIMAVPTAPMRKEAAKIKHRKIYS